MAGNAKKGSTLPQSNGIAATDGFITVIGVGGSSPNNALLLLSTLFANSPVPYVTVGNNAMSTANLIVTPSFVPANSSSNGIQGQIVYDNTHIYVCVSNNSWTRAVLSTF